MKIKHTPGPWFIDSDGEGKPNAIVTSTHDKDGIDDDVCEVYGGNSDNCDTREANAHLISAAPDLLSACKLMAGYIARPEGFGDTFEIMAKAVEAIAKAEGGRRAADHDSPTD